MNDEKDFLSTFIEFVDIFIEIDELEELEDWDCIYDKIKRLNSNTNDLIKIVESFKSKGISFEEYLDKY